jgi:hypothetical protein
MIWTTNHPAVASVRFVRYPDLCDGSGLRPLIEVVDLHAHRRNRRLRVRGKSDKRAMRIATRVRLGAVFALGCRLYRKGFRCQIKRPSRCGVFMAAPTRERC